MSRPSCPELGVAARSLALGGLFLGGLACHGSERGAGESSTAGAHAAMSTPARAAPIPASAAPTPSPLPAPLQALPSAEPRGTSNVGCRVMRVTGDVRQGGAPLAAGVKLDGPPALELGPKATLHLVHTQSARQWVVSGPARLLACDGGAEELSLASGNVRAESGSGVRPGAEVWIGTPFGSLRYADAQGQIEVGPRALTLRLASGHLWFSPLGGDNQEQRRVAAASTTFAAKPYRLATEAAVARCGRDAALAHSRAQALLSPSLAEPLGKLAAEHVRARQRAHASCAGARAAALAAEPVRDQQAGSEALARYDQLWRTLPGPGSGLGAP